jgi:hypothetical protein
VRWGIVIGTFGGFAYGVYAVSRGDADDDFFGERPSSSPHARPLPGQLEHARFAGFRGSAPAEPDPVPASPEESAGEPGSLD